MAHFLVTGAAGFIGSHTVDALLAAGHAVTGVDNFRTGRRENLRPALSHGNFQLVEADVATPGALAAIVARQPVEAIVHLAALVSVQESIANPALNFALNVEATQHVAEAARLHRVGRVIFASSAAVYGAAASLPLGESSPTRPISPYGAAKLASEAILLGHAAAYGYVARCQRYFNVFGPRQDPTSPYSGVISVFRQRYAAGQAVTIFGAGQQSRDFISARDVARANLLAATASASGIANICTGHSTSLLKLVEEFRRHFPAAPVTQHLPARSGDILHSLGDPREAERALGFRAEIPLAAGLAELIRS
jgi:UDP-glucose 4-epimerase